MNLNLIEEVKQIIERNESEINKNGRGFNLISILGMEHNERYTHSNIIAELLKKDGSHGFGNRFFELFLKEVEIKNFDIEDYQVITEEYFNGVKCSDGTEMRTFLDIVIKERKTGRVILIENKIWAEDQFEQIDRYYECYKDNIIKLLYLNVNVWDKCPSDNKEVVKVFQNISYINNISNWIKECLKISSEKPYVNQQIEAYHQTILKISNQDIYKKMNDEIVTHIIKNGYLKEYFDLVYKKEIVELEILKCFIMQSCNIKFSDSNFGYAGTSINLFTDNNIIVDLVFEKKLENLYIKIYSIEEWRLFEIEKKQKITSLHRYDTYLYKMVDEFNSTKWENLLNPANIEKMQQSIINIKEVISKL